MGAPYIYDISRLRVNVGATWKWAASFRSWWIYHRYPLNRKICGPHNRS